MLFYLKWNYFDTHYLSHSVYLTVSKNILENRTCVLHIGGINLQREKDRKRERERELLKKFNLIFKKF